MQNKTCIIIVTFNGINWLPECLKSAKPYSVIIVDNNSTDNTVEYVKAKHPEVNLIEEKRNIGFGQANNIGIQVALEKGAEAVFLLNQDAYLKIGCIEELLNIHFKNKAYGILSPIHLNGSGKFLEKGFSKHMGLEGESNTISNLKNGIGREEVYEVHFVNAAGWLISKECLIKVGGFDPIFFHYGEDVNYIQRIKYYGFKVGVAPKALMCHDREGSAIREGERFSDRYFINRERRCKMEWADINLTDETVKKQIKNLYKKLKKESRQAILHFNFLKVQNVKKEINMLRKIEREVFVSRKRNTKEVNIFSNLKI